MVSVLLSLAASAAAYRAEIGKPLLSLRGGSDASTDDPALIENLLTLKKRLQQLETRLKNAPPPGSKLTPVIADAEIGDRVRVKREVSKPRFDWGDGVTHESVGRLTAFTGERCTVDFPRQPEWNGVLSEMERVASGRSLARIGDRVRVKRDVADPTFGWGPVVDHDAVGEVVSLSVDESATSPLF